MPDVLTYTPQPGFKAYRIIAVHVKAKFSKHFAVPEFEVGVLKAGWRGVEVLTSPTADIVILPDDPMAVHKQMCARYGAAVVKRFHPGPERLGEDMERYAETTLAFIQKCKESADIEAKKRNAAEREGRAMTEKMRAEQAANESRKAKKE